jgi:ATP-binding cassette, subfamily B, bacterial
MPHALSFLFTRLLRATRQVPRFPHAISLVWTAARFWTIPWAALLIAQGLLPIATVYLTRPLVDSLLSAIRSGGSFRPALIKAVLMAGVLLAAEALRGLESWVRTAQSELVRNHIRQRVQAKSAEVDLGFYETPDFFDHLHRAKAEAAHVPLALIENLGGLAQNGITLVAMAVVLTTFGLWLPLALLASTLPALYVVLRYAVRQHEWWVRATPDERRADYYDSVLTSRDHAAELRLFDLGPRFQACFRDLRSELSGERIALARGQSLAGFAAGAAALAITGLSLLWMGRRAFRGQASAGDLALFYQAFQQGLGLARTLLGNVGQIYRNSLFLEGLFEFLDLEPLIANGPDPVSGPERLCRGIRFRSVAFRYPGSTRLALEDFSLEVKAGTIVAIVGENGAGKSTLIKLLCRFYDPDSGSIEIDHRNLRDFALEGLRSRISVLFQEPAHYNATVAANIAPWDGAALEAIEKAARAAGADSVAAKLPLGYEHMLGRWFRDGAELSVGEWQRIALARAFLREAPILVLDEPTSAMDPWAEADWLERFRKLAVGRTAVLITHRFTTARIADRIAVVVDGRVVEQGTHEELLERGGRYAAGWTAQFEGSIR